MRPNSRQTWALYNSVTYLLTGTYLLYLLFFFSVHVGCDAGTRCNFHHSRAASDAARTSCTMTSPSTLEVDKPGGPCVHHKRAASASSAAADGRCDAAANHRGSGSVRQQSRRCPAATGAAAADSELATEVWRVLQYSSVAIFIQKCGLLRYCLPPVLCPAHATGRKSTCSSPFLTQR